MKIKFTQIESSLVKSKRDEQGTVHYTNNLFALGEDGRVYRYVPSNEEKNRYAFWTVLTDHIPDPKDKDKDK